jgi:hypothetical protein
MLRSAFLAVVGAVVGAIAAVVYLASTVVEVPQPIAPGRWFTSYLRDWMKSHEITDEDDATSGLVLGAESGEWIWVTNTPEWDRGWFEERGVGFPARWVPYAALEDLEPHDDGDTIRLPGL